MFKIFHQSSHRMPDEGVVFNQQHANGLFQLLNEEFDFEYLMD